MMALSWMLSLLMTGHCTHHLQGSHLLFKTSGTTTDIPEPSALLMLQVASAALQPIFNYNKKIIQICFLSDIISIV